MTEIASFGEFDLRLRLALDQMETLARQDSEEPFYGSIVRQLKAVQEWTAGGRRPSQENLDKLTFGVMASRVVDDTDRALANELYILADFLVWWPPSVQLWR